MSQSQAWTAINISYPEPFKAINFETMTSELRRTKSSKSKISFVRKIAPLPRKKNTSWGTRRARLLFSKIYGLLQSLIRKILRYICLLTGKSPKKYWSKKSNGLSLKAQCFYEVIVEGYESEINELRARLDSGNLDSINGGKILSFSDISEIDEQKALLIQKLLRAFWILTDLKKLEYGWRGFNWRKSKES